MRVFKTFFAVSLPSLFSRERRRRSSHSYIPPFFTDSKTKHTNRPRRGAQVQPPLRHRRRLRLHRRALPRRLRRDRLPARLPRVHRRGGYHLCARKPRLRRLWRRQERLPGHRRRRLLPDLCLGCDRDDGLGALKSFQTFLFSLFLTPVPAIFSLFLLFLSPRSLCLCDGRGRAARELRWRRRREEAKESISELFFLLFAAPLRESEEGASKSSHSLFFFFSPLL